MSRDGCCSSAKALKKVHSVAKRSMRGPGSVDFVFIYALRGTRFITSFLFYMYKYLGAPGFSMLFV